MINLSRFYRAAMMKRAKLTRALCDIICCFDERKLTDQPMKTKPKTNTIEMESHANIHPAYKRVEISIIMTRITT